MKSFDFTTGTARAALTASPARQLGGSARANGFDLRLGLRAQFEDIGQLGWQPPFDKFFDQRFFAGFLTGFFAGFGWALGWILG